MVSQILAHTQSAYYLAYSWPTHDFFKKYVIYVFDSLRFIYSPHFSFENYYTKFRMDFALYY
jgi:hypothetical protein